MSRVLASHDPTPNDVTKVSQTFPKAFALRASRRVIFRQTTIVASRGSA
jgi:hypothetical protein